MQEDNRVPQDFDVETLLVTGSQPTARREHLSGVWDDIDNELSRHRFRRRTRRAALTTGLVLFGSAFLWVWMGTGNQAWAQLAEQLSSQQWIRLGEDHWISLSKQVSAFGNGNKGAVYEDHRNGIRSEYVPNDDTVYLLNEFEADTTLFELFELVLAGKSPPNETDEVTVVKRVGRITDQRTTEYEAEIRNPNGQPSDRTVIVFSIPDGQRLPTLVTSRSWHSSKPDDKFERKLEITYPDEGPADIFALNVPNTAKIVDRTVAKTVRNIAEKVWAGRREFDSYCGVMVESNDANEPWWKSTTIKRVWRSGLKWRIESCNRDRKVLREIWEAGPPSDDTDRTEWWIGTAARLGSFPESVSDGFESWVFEIDFDRRDKNGNQICSVTDVKKGHLGWFQGGPLPEQGEEAMPELAGRDLLSIGGRPDIVSNLELNNDGGPDGTKLLTVLYSKGHDAGTWQKHWISPALGHLDLQYDFIEPNGKIDRHRIVATAQSPNRFFYPTEIHREVGPDESSIEVQSVFRYYLDFDASIPDELFDPKFTTAKFKP